MHIVLVELQDATIVHSDNQLVGVDDDQPVWMLESEPRRRIGLARITQSTPLCRRPLLEVIWSECDGIELIRLIDGVDAERIVVPVIGKPDAVCPDAIGKVEVQSERRVDVVVHRHANIGSAEA